MIPKPKPKLRAIDGAIDRETGEVKTRSPEYAQMVMDAWDDLTTAEDQDRATALADRRRSVNEAAKRRF